MPGQEASLADGSSRPGQYELHFVPSAVAHLVRVGSSLECATLAKIEGRTGDPSGASMHDATTTE